MKDAGIPVVPGSDGAVTTEEEAFAAAREIGFPVLIKAAAGGGVLVVVGVVVSVLVVPAFVRYQVARK